MRQRIKTIAASFSLFLLIFGLGCGSGLHELPAPSISKVTPQTIPAGSQAQTLSVTGTNFDNAAVILWNGAPLVTKVVSSTTLTGTIGSGNLATPSTAQLQVQNEVTMAESQALPVAVVPTTTSNSSLPPLAITTASLPQATAGTAYSTTISAAGGTSPYAWTLTSGQIPAGLTLSTSGILSGTPTTSGNYSFVLSATDSSSPAQSTTAQVSLSVAAATPPPALPPVPTAPLAITSSVLPTGTSGSPYSGLLQATGGTAPYTWSITAGSLPPGLTLNTKSGLLAGIPTLSGSFSITVLVQDSSTTPQTATAAVSFSIVAAGAPLSIAAFTLPQATATQPYSASLNAAGGTAPYTWSATSSLPNGLTLASNGSITGTPGISGTFSFNVTVTDASNPAQTANGAVTLVVAPTLLTITNATLPSGTIGSAYSHALQAAGGTSPYAWSLTSGAMPAGLTLTTSGSVLGTPTASGTFPFTATVTDDATPQQTKSVQVTLVIVPAGLSLNTASLPSGTVNTGYSVALQATGGTTPYSWSITSGSLPTGLIFVSSTGIVSGIPTVTGTFNFTIAVTDAGTPAQSKSVPYSLTITPATLTITSSTLPSGTNGSAYSNSLEAAGGSAPYTWSVTTGSLPAGLTLGASTGVVSGTPTASGTFTFTASVSDAGSPAQTKTAQVSLVIAPATLTITTTTLPSGTQGESYTGTLRTSGGTAPYTWSITSGALPTGLSLGATTGLITGTPAVSGNFTVTLAVKDSATSAQTATATLPLSIVAAGSPLAIISGALHSGTTNTPYTATLNATGGTAPYTWSVTGGTLPAGFTLASNGSLSGTPTTSANVSFTATVTDSSSPSQTKSATISFTIAPPPLAIITSSLPSGTQGFSYTSGLQATGGTAPYTWSVTGGTLPSGLTLGSNGVVSGTPAVNGTFSLTATITDASSPAQTKSASFVLVIAPPALSITTASFAPGTQAVAYSASLLVTGGTAPYTWSITSGSLPAGLSLSPGTGIISGIPTANGTFNFTATVADAESPAQTKSVALSLVIAAPALAFNSPALPSGTQGSAYTSTLSATGGTAPYTWSISAGSLPTGLSLSATTGLISGTPTANGTFNLTVTVSDASNPIQSKSAPVSLTIAPPTLAITTASLPSGTQGIIYSTALLATGGTTPYTWSITSGSLPAGLSLSPATGLISGTPTASGTFHITATVADAETPAQTKSVAVLLVIAAPTLIINSSSLALGTQGSAYSSALSATGGTAPYTWSVTSGNLPAGLTLASGSGTLSGTPTANGTFAITVTVTDSSSPSQSKSVALSLVIAPPALHLTTSSLPSGTQNSGYSQTLIAIGGTAPYSWSIVSGNLPAGLTLNPAAGTLAGTPTASGSFSVTIAVKDSSTTQQTANATLSLTIAAAIPTLTITSSSLSSGTANKAYSATLAAIGGTAPYTWSITSGSLPSGITLNPATGSLAGTPTASGSFTATFTVKDSSTTQQTASTTLSLTIAAAVPTLTITSSSLASGTANKAYSATLAATGGTAPYTWSITSGSLPSGITLNASTGSLSGTPTATGSFALTFTVKDSSTTQQTATVGLSLSITASALTITTGTLASGTDGTAYSAPMSATGGTPAYTWSITSGSLPAGLTLAATTGIISGTPTGTGTTSFTATVTDNSTPTPQTKSASVSITVSAAAPTGPGTTWYIRADGGTRYSAHATAGQCDGKADVAYPGTGTNQHCAFNDYRFLYDDQSYGNYSTWVISGGDTVILRGGPWRVGFNQGKSASDTWCVGSGDPYDCTNPVIPAGTATQPTRILGENYGSCTQSNMTQLYGGFGLYTTLDLDGAQFVTVQCVELTRHSDCIRLGSPAYPSTCSTSYPIDDFATNGIITNTSTHDVTLQDMWIHGFPSRGIIGPIGGTVNATRVDIAYNGGAGWDFDDGQETPNKNGIINLSSVTVEWSGCNQAYPGGGVASCYSQSTGGYGDGIGTPAGTCLTAHVDHSTFRYNTQDGYDMLHNDTGSCSMSITDSTSYGNNGAQFKWGPNDSPMVFTNNTVVANCLRLSAPFPGAPSNYNANLQDFCRAEDALAMGFRDGGSLTMENNTIVTYAPTTFDISCWGTYPDGQGTGTCNNASFTFENNVVRGYDNSATYNLGGQSGGPGLFYYGGGIGHITQNHNLYFGIGHNFACPTGYPNEQCSNPDFVNEPVFSGEASLDNFNFNITSGSPAVGSGLFLPSLTLDYSGATRPNPPSLGALEP